MFDVIRVFWMTANFAVAAVPEVRDMLPSRQLAHAMLCLLLFVVMGRSHAQGSIELRTVALSGEQAPGVEAGVKYDGFPSFRSMIQLNDAGQIAYIASLAGPGVDPTNDKAAFGPGFGRDLTAVIRESAQVPGMAPGFTYGPFVVEEPFRLNNAGQIAIYHGINPLETAILAPDNGQELAPIAVVDEAIPSLGENVFYRNFWHYNLNNNGHSAFYTTYWGLGATGQYKTAIMSNVDGVGMTPVARSDWHAPGLPSDVLYLYVGEPLLNDLGQIAYHARLAENGDNNSTDDAFYKYNNRTGADYFLLARDDEQIPGYETGVRYWSMTRETLSMNNVGQVIFSAAIRGNGIVAPYNRAIFMTTNGSDVTTLVRYGNDAPGLGGEVRYKSTELDSIQLNDLGQISFHGYITGVDVVDDNDAVLFGPRGGTALTAIAREHDPVPGFPEGAIFRHFFSHLLNDAGQVAFYAGLNRAVTNDTYTYGLFATDLAGNVCSIATRGDILNVSNDPQLDDFRIVESLGDYNLNSDFGDYAFNNRGEVAFRAVFSDGSSGIFVATIPAPCVADVNGDGSVTPADFGAWIMAFNTMTLACDQNRDGLCSPADLGAWIISYNQGCN